MKTPENASPAKSVVTNVLPKRKKRISLPPSIYRNILQCLSITARIKVISQLFVGGILFTMSPCEYTLSIRNNSDRHTIIFQSCDIKFFKHYIQLLNKYYLLHFVDYIAITFRFIKHDEADEKTILHTTNDQKLCPVNLWVETI